MTLQQTSTIDAAHTADLVAALRQLRSLKGTYNCPAAAPGYEYGPILLSLSQPTQRHVDVLLDYLGCPSARTTGSSRSLLSPAGHTVNTIVETVFPRRR